MPPDIDLVLVLAKTIEFGVFNLCLSLLYNLF